MSASPSAQPKSAVSFLKIPESGDPYLEGHRCSACGTVFLETRRACPKCFTIGALKPEKLAETGTLSVFTVVYRSFPGIKTPYISAIVDLDGGGSLKGNLVDVEADPAKISFNMPVKIVYRDAGRQDKAGNSYLAYFFVPANETQTKEGNAA